MRKYIREECSVIIDCLTFSYLISRKLYCQMNSQKHQKHCFSEKFNIVSKACCSEEKH